MNFLVDAGIYGTNMYADQIRNLSSAIDELIQRRHSTNPNRCEHEIVVSYGKKVCTKCIALLGQEIGLNINFN